MSISGSGRVIFPPKRMGMSVSLGFNFTSFLAAGETISTQVVTSQVYSGVDPTPSGMISGSATASGAIVSQLVIAGVAGVIYWLLAKITTSAGQTLELGGFLSVMPDLGQ